MKISETERLIVRRLGVEDCAFILELLNQPSWLQYIGDKGVKTLSDAEMYIRNGPMDMYERLGFGLFAVDLKESGEPVGICGLIKRETLDNVDIGFAILERHHRKGYACESAEAVMEFAKKLELQRVVAITTQDNSASGALLEKLGFTFKQVIVQNGEELSLYACDLTIE